MVAAADAGPIDVSICGYIGDDYWDESAMSEHKFTEALKSYARTRELNININSQGGSVKDGLGIYNFLKRWEGKTTARISGFACSIASVIPLACDRVISPKSSNWMIHDPLCMTAGNSEDHQKSIEMLESCAATMAAIYAEKTGMTRKQARDLMKAETWFTGEEAKQVGLSDETNDDAVALNVTEAIKEFRNVPQRLVAMLTHKQTPPANSAGQHTNQMQKEKIIALLAKHGKTLDANATDEQFLTALTELVAANKVPQAEADALKTPKVPVMMDPDRVLALETALRQERETRITQEFRVEAIDRPFLTESEWLPRLFRDDSLMATIKAMPKMGADPVKPSLVVNNGNSLIEDYKKMKPGPARKAFALEHWNSLEDQMHSHRIQQMSSLPIAEQLRRLHNPQAANTYSATLVTDRLADAFITTIGTKLAALRGFSRDFGTDTFKPLATVQVAKATAAATTQTNATNFESGDSTTTAVSVTVAQISQTFHTLNSELNKGHTLMRVAEKNAQGFANALSDIWTALLTAANYGAVTVIGAAANFDANDLAPIYALAKNYGSKNLILDGGHLAYLLPTDKFKFRLGEEGAYNFDLIAEQNRWTSAAANTVGFVCDPNAIAVASGLPVSLPASEFIELGTVNVESLGLTVLMTHWFSRAGRQHWMSYDVMFGAAAGDTTAGEVLTSA